MKNGEWIEKMLTYGLSRAVQFVARCSNSEKSISLIMRWHYGTGDNLLEKSLCCLETRYHFLVEDNLRFNKFFHSFL